MITQELLTVDEGELYLDSRPIAQYVLGYIQERGAIEWSDLEALPGQCYDMLDSDQWQELKNDGLVKFFLDALVGYGFVAQEAGNKWRFVVGREVT